MATVVNTVLSPRQTSHVRVDTEAATVELDHLYGYDDDAGRVTPAPGAEEAVERAWSAAPAGTASSHLAQLAAVLGA